MFALTLTSMATTGGDSEMTSTVADLREEIPPARHPGLPIGVALSPSRANDFLTCPLLFRLRAIDRLPERPSPAAARGTLVHAVLERLFDLPAEDRSLESAKELVEASWRQLADEDPRLWFALDEAAPFDPDGTDSPEISVEVVAEWVKSATPLLRTYFDLEDPTRLDPTSRELRVEVDLGDGLALRGIVDRIDTAPGDLVRVVDYKTGRAPGAGFEQKSMFQMRFYALILFRLTGNLPKRLQLMYLGDGQVLHYEPSEADLVSFEKNLRALWRAITTVAESGDWQPKPSRMCNWCDHHALCPAQGGTTPSLPVDIELSRRPVALAT